MNLTWQAVIDMNLTWQAVISMNFTPVPSPGATPVKYARPVE
jgi:hypothetical protein